MHLQFLRLLYCHPGILPWFPQLATLGRHKRKNRHLSHAGGMKLLTLQRQHFWLSIIQVIQSGKKEQWQGQLLSNCVKFKPADALATSWVGVLVRKSSGVAQAPASTEDGTLGKLSETTTSSLSWSSWLRTPVCWWLVCWASPKVRPSPQRNQLRPCYYLCC